VDQRIMDNPQARRFEFYQGDVLAGFAEYRLHSHEIALVHTETVTGFEGRGVGGTLARYVLDDARRRGLGVLPYCPFIRDWIAGHPEYTDVVPETRRARFDL
jgi:predicted GNAT family acetyltransferase